MISRLILCSMVLVIGVATLGAEEPKNVTPKSAADGFDLLIGKDLVASYHHKDVSKPYLWPLNAPGGVPVTRAWPMEKALPGGSTDHPHQKSAWFCHGDVIPEGIQVKEHIKGIEGVDFWSEAKGHGRIVCLGERWGGRDTSARNIWTYNEWRTASDAKILDEVRNITLHNLGDARLFVFNIDLHASVCPITFGDTKEGSFAVRVHDAIREEKGNGKITNAEGKVGEKECWGRISAWCDYSGKVEDKPVGITIFADPKNPYPTCWHVRGYGLMGANPFGRDKSGFPDMKGKTDLVKLAKGEHLKLRYGLLLHTGDVKDGKVAERYEQFVKEK